MCSAVLPGRDLGGAGIVVPRIRQHSASGRFHRAARGSSNRVRERVPNRVLPLLRFLCSHARCSSRVSANLTSRAQKGPPSFPKRTTNHQKGPVPGFATGEMGFRRRFAQQQSCIADVRYGSKADIEARPVNVRFTPESGHCNRSVYHRHRPKDGGKRGEGIGSLI
jgi:hypothetical protein